MAGVLAGCGESGGNPDRSSGDDAGSGAGGSISGAGGSISGAGGSSSGSGGAGGAGGASPAVPGTVVDAEGNVDCDAYRSLAADYPALIDYLNGPAYEAFHPGPAPAVPTVFDRDNGGRYCFGDCEAQAVDWTGYSGQVLHVEDGPGLSRTRFIWSKHTGHGGSQFHHLYYLAPVNDPAGADSDAWYTSVVDPAVDVPAWMQATGGQRLSRPVAIGRGRVTWSNNGIIAFHGGLIGAVGSGNSSDDFPFTLLRPGEVPTDVAVTPSSEFALVTVWDTQECKGRVAVLAPTARDGFLPGLPNAGFFESIKLLGYVDLPVAAPIRISASVDFAPWMTSPSRDAQAELATESGRAAWSAGADEAHAAAKAGYALVASRDESKVVVLDLQPLLQYFRSMYLGTQESYDQTRNVGAAGDQWPFSFAEATAATPEVAEVLEVPRPSVVVTGFPVGDRSFTDGDFAGKAYVGTVDGQLLLYAAGGLASDGAATPLALTAEREICRNPTRADYGRGGKSRDGLVLACRGDRKLLFFDGGGSSVRELQDSRLSDPVAVSLGDSRGASVVSVASFSSREVLSYLTAPIDAWGEPIFGGLGAGGDAEFEFTGRLEVGGQPFDVSAAEVP